MATHRVAEPRPRRTSRRILLVAAVVIAALIAGTSVAFAYWRSSGSGSGAGTTGTMTINVTAVQAGDASGATTLVPGASGDVLLRVTNPNSYSVQVSGIAGNGTITADNGCSTTGITFSSPASYVASQFTLSPGSNLLRLSGALSMNTSVSSACQGATFTIPVAVTVQR